MNQMGSMSITHGKIHTFLGMDFDYTKPGKVCISMEKFTSQIVDGFEFSTKRRVVKNPASGVLFHVRPQT